MVVRLTLDPAAPDARALGRAAEHLAAGRVVAYPTDTLYGLAADPRSARAVGRVFAVKARQAGVALPLIAADLDQVLRLGPLTPAERRLAEGCWPGPLTIVIRAEAALARDVLGADGTVAVRVPSHEVARGLARAFGHPVTATSANVSGRRPYATADEVQAAVGASLAMIIDAGPTPGGPPSTIVRLESDAPRLLRAGAIPFERVLELLR
jgi:L-threonylcarbamoyladenylate synthase